MVTTIIFVACAFVFICGLFKLGSGYGTGEGLVMMFVSVVIAALVYNNTIKVDDDFIGELPDMEEVQEVVGRHFYVEDEEPEVPDTITIVKKFKPIEPVYDTVEVIEELVEEYPPLEKFDIVEIETTENLDIDSLMTVHSADSIHVEIIE